VMEYNALAEGVIIGRQIVDSVVKPLSYDELAIAHAYLGKSIDRSSAPLFCTDSQAEVFKLDCVRFDRGATPIEGSVYALRTALEQASVDFVEKALAQMTTGRAEARPAFADIKIDPALLTLTVSNALKNLLGWTVLSERSYIVERKHSAFLFGFDELKKRRFDYVTQAVKDQGGVDKVFFEVVSSSFAPTEETTDESLRSIVSSNWPEIKAQEVRDYLAKASVRRFVGADGQERILEDSQVEALGSAAVRYFTEVRKLVLSEAFKVYAKHEMNFEIEATAGLEKDGFTESYEKALGRASGAALTLAKSGESSVGVKFNKRAALWPAFALPVEVRLEAAKALGAESAELPRWLEKERSETSETLETLFAKAFGVKSLDQVREAIEKGDRSLAVQWGPEDEVISAIQGQVSPVAALIKVIRQSK